LIPLVDLVAQYQDIRSEIDAAIQGVLESGRFILGPNVAAFEAEIAAYLGVGHAVGVASGTDALVLALRALRIGVRDEVIVPAYSFFATAGAVLTVGARPVFVDIDPRTYCLDVQQVAGRVTSATRAVIPVHLYGHPTEMGPLLELARSHGLSVIEDNAQAIGAEYQGMKTGRLGDIACLSFFPSKNLGGYGDGGMVVTRHPELAERVRQLRTHGWNKKYFPEELGYNSRLDELQAGILRVKLHHLEAWNEKRRSLAEIYRQRLAGRLIGLPIEAPGCRHVYHLYVLRVANRDQVQASLKMLGIASEVYYPQPLHLTQPCRSLGHHSGDFPVAEQASRETLAIPLYPELDAARQEQVISALQNLSALLPTPQSM
jgi:dTDP-4-amino-4,6-dideoxygalactose transaminase